MAVERRRPTGRPAWWSTARSATAATRRRGRLRQDPPRRLPAGRRTAGGRPRSAPGERTPLFRIGAERFRWSWYLRLPGPATHAWCGRRALRGDGDLPLGRRRRPGRPGRGHAAPLRQPARTRTPGRRRTCTPSPASSASSSAASATPPCSSGRSAWRRPAASPQPDRRARLPGRRLTAARGSGGGRVASARGTASITLKFVGPGTGVTERRASPASSEQRAELGLGALLAAGAHQHVEVAHDHHQHVAATPAAPRAPPARPAAPCHRGASAARQLAQDRASARSSSQSWITLLTR